VNRPVIPANTALPLRADAAPVAAGEEDEGDIDDEVPFSPSMPPLPATVVGETFSLASIEAFMKASSVFAPILLEAVSEPECV
jgi:hypothetical protein